MTEMIEGVSPLAIGSIRKFRFRRHGYHPLHDRLLEKKKPWLRYVPLSGVFAFRSDPWDWVTPAHFDIIGTDGDRIKTVYCRSKSELDERASAAQEKLDQFLANIQGKGYTNE